jgi:hypothetical protein
LNSIIRASDSYTILFENYSCRVSGDLEGMEYISYILSADQGRTDFIWTVGKHSIQRDVFLVALGSSRLQPGARQRLNEPRGLLTPAKINKHIAAVERQAKFADESGDSANADRLRGEVNQLRAYLRSTKSCGTHHRHFADESSRAADSTGKAISRAIAEIRKESPEIADHFRNSILPAGHGWWFYDGDRETWDFAVVLSAPPGEPRGTPAEPDPDQIRETWLSSTPRAGAWWNATPEETKKWVLDRLLGRGDKPFGINRPANKGGEGKDGVTRQLEDEALDWDQRGETETREGDDRESEDFEAR